MNDRKWPTKLSTSERIAAAKQKTARVVDHLQYLLELHENNAIVVYSPTLSAQIPRSHAANAFNVFQRAMHQFEIVRLCALWDSADPEKDSSATKFESLTFDEAYAKNLNVMDMTAFTLCRENNLPIIVFDINRTGNLLRLLQGEKLGTMVHQ